jgi:hypothetical protein
MKGALFAVQVFYRKRCKGIPLNATIAAIGLPAKSRQLKVESSFDDIIQ